MADRRSGSEAAFTLTELVVVALLLGAVAVFGLRHGSESLAREEVESASRRIALGLEQGRLAAMRSGRPCVLSLEQQGWRTPLGASLPGCRGPQLAAGETTRRTAVRLEHNLPPLVRFSTNGLVLDGGTVVISAEGTELERCLVMSLPLGVVRLGRWQANGCEADPRL
ncbi:MAG: GspH/FimT family pseudopilin [Cyanobium sp.]